MSRNVSILALCAAGVLFAGSAEADTSKMKIAFSNNYAGNSWRQAMLKSYDIVSQEGGRRQASSGPRTCSPPPTRKCRRRRRRSRT